MGDPYRRFAAAALLCAARDIQKCNGYAAEAREWLTGEDATLFCRALGMTLDLDKLAVDEATNWTVAELTAATGLSTDWTVRDAIKRGELRGAQMVGQEWRIPADEARRWLAEWKARGPGRRRRW